MQRRFKLVEREAGEILHAETFESSDLEAEHRQAERWNRLYSVGEPRVASRLYRLERSRWLRWLSLGA